MSLIEYFNWPISFGEQLLLFTFILTLSPYLNNMDFGFVKIPEIPPKNRIALMIVGPISFFAAIAIHFPFIPEQQNFWNKFG